MKSYIFQHRLDFHDIPLSGQLFHYFTFFLAFLFFVFFLSYCFSFVLLFLIFFCFFFFFYVFDLAPCTRYTFSSVRILYVTNQNRTCPWLGPFGFRLTVINYFFITNWLMAMLLTCCVMMLLAGRGRKGFWPDHVVYLWSFILNDFQNAQIISGPLQLDHSF